jgi:predicted ATPase
MRLKSVFINQYKNLRNFSLTFEGSSFLDVFVGKNGSGKSNLFEALIEIFRHLDEFGGSDNAISFEYRVQYEIDGADINIEWTQEKLIIDGRERRTMGSTRLPDNILIYYSGHNHAVTDIVDRYEAAFRRKIKEANLGDSRRFLSVGPDYKALLLTMLLAQPAGSKAREFVQQKLGITAIGDSMLVTLIRPAFASGRLRSLDATSIETFDPRTHYWGADGITREFVEKLVTCVKGEFRHDDIYDQRNDRYNITIDLQLFHTNFTGEEMTDIFRQFDNLKTLGMLNDIGMPLKVAGGADSNLGFFSDGQFQAVYIYAIVELFKDRNCLTLLDEPDAFLHPEWQFEFLKQVVEITEEASRSNHVLLSSHSAATLCSLEEPQIRLLKIEGAAVSCVQRSKKEIVSQLSDSFIQYSEDESKLLIDNVIRSSSKPILFVEGPSDVSILNEAYRKLYPNEEVSVLVQDAFDRGFLRILFGRDDIFHSYPQKTFFALFDFDAAYDDWRGLGGAHHVIDIELGLCKKLDNKKAYAFMLPIPNNQLRDQVWDESNPNEKVKPNRHFCIEHAFWGVTGLEGWFKADLKSGVISFKGDKHKVKFAKEVVPTLDATCFEVFRPMFDSIRSMS